jgi:hypothetical protein
MERARADSICTTPSLHDGAQWGRLHTDVQRIAALPSTYSGEQGNDRIDARTLNPGPPIHRRDLGLRD